MIKLDKQRIDNYNLDIHSTEEILLDKINEIIDVLNNLNLQNKNQTAEQLVEELE